MEDAAKLDRHSVTVSAVHDAPGRAAALEVLQSTYRDEKGWVTDAASLFPIGEIDQGKAVWLVAVAAGQPVGALRVGFDPPLEAYARYGLEFLDPTLDVASFLRLSRIAEIGRFAIVPGARGAVMVPLALMRSAIMTTVRREYTHFVTDVLEDDRHSPRGFHTRVLGFQEVATHKTGELRSDSRRITLVLDIQAAYRRLGDRRNWVFRYLSAGWEDELRKRLGGS